MKILHISPDLHTGGAQKFCVDICNELAKNEEDEVVLCSLEKMNEKQKIMFNNIHPNVKFICLDKVGNGPQIIWKIFKMLWREKPDITHTHLRAQFFAALPLLLMRKPNIHTIHSVAQKETPKMRRKLYKLLYDYFNFTPVAISDMVLASMKEEYGEQYTTKIDNGAQPLHITPQYQETKAFIESLKKDDNTKIFVSVGRLFPVKNQTLLIDAFEKLLAKGYDAHLLIIGAYDIVPEFTNACREKIQTPQRIHMLGEKSNVADYLKEADALCFSSLYEGMPITVLEAFSLGTPTVSTPVGGMPDIIIDGETGYLSKDMQPESYCEAMEKIIQENSIDAKSLIECFNRKYTIQKCAAQYRELYRNKVDATS
jgi:glycosyltransferase involved in cell wall biosynthesis